MNGPKFADLNISDFSQCGLLRMEIPSMQLLKLNDTYYRSLTSTLRALISIFLSIISIKIFSQCGLR